MLLPRQRQGDYNRRARIAMKILLTGKPKSGKTTLLNNLLKDAQNKQGMVAVEVLEREQRIGFNLQDSSGRLATLAQTNHKTNISVGRYFVDVQSLESFIEPLFTFEPGQLLYIDEIGHMQLYSKEFQKLVQSYLNAPNDYVGTISSIYEHPFINEVKSRSDVLLCTVTPDNRDEMFVFLNAALKHRSIFNSLSTEVQTKILSMARTYLASQSYLSLKKLFSNAIVYVSEKRVQKTPPHSFVVQGNHAEHTVSLHENAYRCDCDFFNGREQFAGNAGECSHIQAVKVLK